MTSRFSRPASPPSARQALAVAWRDWQNTQAATFTDAVYTPAAAAFLDALRLDAAVATELGSHRLHAITRGVYLPAASDPIRGMANPKRINWREHPAAALYNRLVAFRMEVTRHMDGFIEPEANDDAACSPAGVARSGAGPQASRPD